jgi:hypothetical protein
VVHKPFRPKHDPVKESEMGPTCEGIRSGPNGPSSLGAQRLLLPGTQEVVSAPARIADRGPGFPYPMVIFLPQRAASRARH